MRKYHMINGRFLFVTFGALMAMGCMKIYVKNAIVAKGYRLSDLKDEEIVLQTERGILEAKLEAMLQRDQLDYLASALPEQSTRRSQVAQVKHRKM